MNYLATSISIPGNDKNDDGVSYQSTSENMKSVSEYLNMTNDSVLVWDG